MYVIITRDEKAPLADVWVYSQNKEEILKYFEEAEKGFVEENPSVKEIINIVQLGDAKRIDYKMHGCRQIFHFFIQIIEIPET